MSAYIQFNRVPVKGDTIEILGVTYTFGHVKLTEIAKKLRKFFGPRLSIQETYVTKNRRKTLILKIN